MRESCASGSVRGASSDRRLYSTIRSASVPVPQPLGEAVVDHRLADDLGGLCRPGLRSRCAAPCLAQKTTVSGMDVSYEHRQTHDDRAPAHAGSATPEISSQIAIR
jgi:hypothetical protein